MGVPSTRRACAWLLGCKDPESAGQDPGLRHRFVETLCRVEPSIAEARGLAQRFLGFIHRHDVAGFDRWLPRVQACAVPELRRFAANLTADLSAVRAAFSSPWSSGQVEGQINRLKYLKRQMYGRAKLDLLRIRVLHPN
jgi:transposase